MAFTFLEARGEKYMASLGQDGEVNLVTIRRGNFSEEEVFQDQHEAREILVNDREYFDRIYSGLLKAAGIFAIALGVVAEFKGTKDTSGRLQAAGALSSGLGSLSIIKSLDFDVKATKAAIQAEIVGDLTPAKPSTSFPSR